MIEIVDFEQVGIAVSVEEIAVVAAVAKFHRKKRENFAANIFRYGYVCGADYIAEGH